jgi:hypothetical protein
LHGAGQRLVRRAPLPGQRPKGELGFRFGEPLDVDGDGAPTLPPARRMGAPAEDLQNGKAFVWSARARRTIRAVGREWADGYFGTG